MADERLSEKDKQLNPVLDYDHPELSDHIYLINYTGVADPETGSLWQTLQLGLTYICTLILNHFKSIGSANTITSSFFELEDVNVQYICNQHEFIESIILKGIAPGSTATVEYYTLNLSTGMYELNSIIMQESNILNILNYFDSANSLERKITISPSADCTIIIKSVKGL